MSVNIGTDMAAELRRIRARAAGPAIKAATTAGGRAGETAVKMALTRYTHSAGTPTPAPAGGPPALVGGQLRRSIHRTPTALIAPGCASSTWGPTVIYGIVQEFGMTISVRNKMVLANVQTGQVFGPQVTIPPRPFMAPTGRRLASSGLATQMFGKAFFAALIA